jgi:hypothetical protein
MGPQFEWLAAARQIAQAFDSRLLITGYELPDAAWDLVADHFQ